MPVRIVIPQHNQAHHPFPKLIKEPGVKSQTGGLEQRLPLPFGVLCPVILGERSSQFHRGPSGTGDPESL